MAKRRRESHSDFAAPEAEERRIVYVDTSLETCLGVAISKSDTLSDLKNKVVLDHLRLFPEHGEIMVDRLKVKLKGKFYPLADHTLVHDVFPLAKPSAFFFADISSIPINYMSPKSLEHDESDGLRVELGRASDENYGFFSLDVPKVQPLMISLPDGGDSENCKMMEWSRGKSPVEKRMDDLVESSLESESRAKKKLKIELNESINHSQSVEDDHDIFHETDKDNLMVHASENVTERILVCNQLEKPMPGENVGESSTDVAREIVIHNIFVNLQSHLDSDSKKADTLLENAVDRTISCDKFDIELGQNAQVDNVEGADVANIESNNPVRPVDNSDKIQKKKSGSKKKRKRRDDNRSAGIQDSRHLDQGTENSRSVEGTCINMGAEKSSIETIANSQDVFYTDRKTEGVLLQNGTSKNDVAEKSEKELNLSEIERNDAEQDADCSKGNLTSVPAVVEESVPDLQYQLALDKTNEDTALHNGTSELVTRESENKLGEINPAKHLEDTTIRNGTMESGKSTGSKKRRKKKKKAQKEAGEIQDTSNLQHENGKGEFVEPNTETLESGKAKESVVSLNLDEVMMLPLIKTSDVSPNLTGEVIAEAKITRGSRKKKKKKNVDAYVLAAKESLTGLINPELQQSNSSSPIVPDIPQENTDVVQTTNTGDKMDYESALEGSNFVTTQRNAQKEAAEILQHETGKGEFVEPNQETLESGKSNESVLSLNLDEVMMLPFIKASDVSRNLMGEVIVDAGITGDSRKKKKKKIKGKIPGDNNLESDKNMADFVATQTEQTLVTGGSDIVMVEKDQNPADVMKDTLEFNQIDEIENSTEDKQGKTKMKRKKILNVALDVEANLQGKDKKSDANVSATKESLISIKNPEVQQRNFSSPIIPEKNSGVVQTANPDEEINFAHYFVPDQSNQKSSVNALKGSNVEKLQEDMTIQKQNEAQPPQNRTEMMNTNPQEKSLLTKLAASSQDSSSNMKTPEKKSLLAKPGLIFQDYNEEESTDENRKIDPDDSSDSSDSSSDSDKEIGLNDEKERSSGGKNKSRLDLSAMNGMTIDKLLRSSSQYRKAQIQSELELDEDQPPLA